MLIVIQIVLFAWMGLNMFKIFQIFLIVSFMATIPKDIFSINLDINNSKSKPKLSASLRPSPRSTDELLEGIATKGIADFVEDNLTNQRSKGSSSEYTVPDSLKTLMEVVTPENNLNPSFDSLFLNDDLKNELKKYKESLELDLSKKAGASSVAKPLFLQGPPGAGKTFSIQSLAKGIRIYSDKKEKKPSGLTFITVSTSSVSPEDLDDIYLEISTNKQLGSMVILLDEVDAAGRDREKLLEANQFDAVKLVNALLMFVNKIKSFNELQVAKVSPANRKLIFLMTAANYPVDKAFQDRFRSVVFRAPEEEIRKNLLFLNLGKAGINLSGSDHPMIKRLALKTKGFSVRDIESVVANASEAANAGVNIKIQPFLDAIAMILKERQQKINNELTGKIEFYFFNDITSADSIQKTDLKSEFKYTLADKYSVVKDFANSFLSDIENNKAADSTPKTKRRALLFYGPPGTGKTYVAKAIAKQAKSNLIIINSGTLLTKFQGSGAESLLKILSFAKNNSPCILFFDEVDAIGDKKATEPERANMRQTLQMEMTNPSKPGEEIAFMAATNYPSNLEDAIKNRFTIQCPLYNPNYLGRIQLLANNIKKTAPASADLNKIIAQLNSCTFLKEMRREDSKSFDDITIKFLTRPAARNLAPFGLSVGEKLSEAGDQIQYFKIPILLSDQINKSPDIWILDEQEIETKEKELHVKALEDLKGSLGLSEYKLFKENLKEAGELKNMNSGKDLIILPSISEKVQKERSDAFDEIAEKYKDLPTYVLLRELAAGEPTVSSKISIFKEFTSKLILQPELAKWLKPERSSSQKELKDNADLARRSGINVCDAYNKARLSVLKNKPNFKATLSAVKKSSRSKGDTKLKHKAKKLSQAERNKIMFEILSRRSLVQ